MILNMLKIKKMSPELVLQNSFYQFQNALSIPKLKVGKYLSSYYDLSHYNCYCIIMTME